MGRLNSHVLWFSGNTVTVQTAEQFSQVRMGATCFSSMGDMVSLNRLYFVLPNPLVHLLPDSGILVVCGMAHESVIKTRRSQWDSESCISLWDLRTGNLLCHFLPKYAFGDFYRVVASPDERYVAISQLHEGEDLHVIDVAARKELIQTSGRLSFFRSDNTLVLLPSVGYDGPNGGLRVYDPSNNRMTEVLSQDRAYEKGLDFRDAVVMEASEAVVALCGWPQTTLRHFALADLLAGRSSSLRLPLDKDLKPSCLVLDSLGQQLISASDNDMIRRVDVAKELTGADRLLDINPKPIGGSCFAGWAMDLHTLSSIPLDPDHHVFDTKRSEIGEAVYNLKYRDDRSWVSPIASTIAAFVAYREDFAGVKAVLAVPASNLLRAFQPVPAIASAIGQILELPVPVDYILKTRETIPLKGIDDQQRRHEALQDAFRVADERFAGAHVLLVDDLFRSGETLDAVAAILVSQGKVGKVSVVTATMTRSRR